MGADGQFAANEGALKHKVLSSIPPKASQQLQDSLTPPTVLWAWRGLERQLRCSVGEIQWKFTWDLCHDERMSAQ